MVTLPKIDASPSVEEIIAENHRRNSLITAPFNPITGEGSIGPRFRIDRPGDSPIFLPLSMKEEPLVEKLIQGYISPDSKEFVRLRCLHDFPFWAAKFAYIKRKGGGEDMLFILNRAQRHLVSVLEEMRLAGKPIRLILLKARQWGGSTCVQIYMIWLQVCHALGLNSLIIAHQAVATYEIKDMFDRLVEAYPAEMLLDKDGEPGSPKEKKLEGVDRGGATHRLIRRNCKIKVGTAERPDSCRGGDYSLVHCSEVGIWKATAGKSPEMILRAACSGVLLRPLTMIVYESTANGTGNFFHREYEAARRRESQFEPLFIPWFEIDQYTMPVPDPEAMVRSMLADRENEAATSDRRQPGAYIWWLWQQGATLEAIAWYQAERAKYSDHGLMAAEYPSDDVEAFVHSGAAVFDRYRVEALRPGCRTPAFTGDFDSPLKPSGGVRPDTDFRRRQIQEVEFTPRRNGGGEWKIWRLPCDDKEMCFENRYLVVVDVGGRSVKADWSVIAVFDREPMCRGEGPEIVAQWRGHCDFDRLAWKAALGASFYDDALLVIESNTIETHEPERNTDGEQSLFLFNRLRDVYPNLYARPGSEEDVMRGAPAKYGFHTNMATKPAIIATLVEAIREGLYIERDAAVLDEFLSYERRPNGSYGAILGCHDDLLMTRAIGLHLCFNELSLPRVSSPANTLQNPGMPASMALW
ncbi:MAG: terminase [Muribaculaceae bacterium]|nr:terminase [Muribaculaceae bacterium]